MDSRLFLLRRWLRKGSRFLRGARLYRRAAPAALPAAISVSRGERISRRYGTSGLPTGVQHTGAIGTHATEPALPLCFTALRRWTSAETFPHSEFRMRLPGLCPSPSPEFNFLIVNIWNIRPPGVGCSLRR